MKIENLKVGQVFKNYKDLCNELEVEHKAGKSKQLQIKDWYRYFSYSKEGHKFIVNEVYKTPIKKIDNRGKDSKYGEFVQLLVLDLLAQCKSDNVSISRNKLMLAINMINSNYGTCSENVRKLSIYANIDERVVYDFYNTNNSNFKSTVETALKNLMDKRIIWVDMVTKVAVKDSKIHRIATRTEKVQILDIEKLVLNELGYKNVSQVRVSGEWKKFKNRTRTLLNFQSDINYYYSAYNITVNEKYIDNEREELIKYLLSNDERKNLKGKLNESIMNNIFENAEKRQKKGFTNGKKAKIRMSESYVDDIKRLSNLLINSDTESFIKEMLNDEGVLTNEILEQVALLEDLFA